MTVITINAFQGAALALDDLLLPAGVGTDSQNQRPGHSDLRPWFNPSAVASVPSGAQRRTIYRMGQGVASDTNYWLQWTAVVNAVRGYESPDTSERTYFTGSGAPKWTDNNIGLSGGAPYPQATRDLGVPAPTTALTAAVNAAVSTGTEETDYWVYTWVNDLGWESAPSPPSNSLLIKPGTTVNLTGFDTVPSGNFSITGVRIYRTSVGTSGATAFFYLRTLVYGAALSQPVDDARALGSDTLQTVGWLPCPGIATGGAASTTEDSARGLTKLWNGMMAVITGKAIRLCEPYKAYAWPLKYEIATPDDPVGIAVWQQRALILTSGDAYLVTGSTPSAMDSEPLKLYQPCVSVTSVVEFDDGVAWASPNGLWWYGSGGARNLLAGVMTREQWQALVPSTIVASRYLGCYIAFFNDGSGLRGFVMDPANADGIYWLSAGYSAVHRDPLQDKLYVLDGTSIKAWNVPAAGLMTASFRSKRVRLPMPMSVGAVEVIAKAYPVTIKLYADDVLWHTQSVSSDDPIRPPDKQAMNWACEVSSSNRVIAVRMARSVADLREAS